VEKIIALEGENHGHFVEFPPVRPALAVDESKRIRHLELLQEDMPGDEPQ